MRNKIRGHLQLLKKELPKSCLIGICEKSKCFGTFRTTDKVSLCDFISPPSPTTWQVWLMKPIQPITQISCLAKWLEDCLIMRGYSFSQGTGQETRIPGTTRRKYCDTRHPNMRFNVVFRLFKTFPALFQLLRRFFTPDLYFT